MLNERYVEVMRTIVALALTFSVSLGYAAERWTPIGPFGGDGASLAIDPHAPDTYYATTFDLPYVFRTTDGGVHWSSFPVGLPGEFLSAGGLTLDPDDGSIIYALAGVGGLFPVSTVVRSTDRGEHWTPTPLTSLREVRDFALLPTHPRVLLAGNDKAVVRWVEGESTTTHVPLGAGIIWDLTADTLHPGTVYSGVRSDQGSSALGGVYKSTDGGVTWVNLGLEDVIHVVLDPLHSETVYAKRNAFLDPFLKSTDGGAHWMLLPSPDGLSTEWHDQAVDPLVVDTLYAWTAGGLSRSTNGGGLWSHRSGFAEFGTTDLRFGVATIVPHPTVRDRLFLVKPPSFLYHPQLGPVLRSDDGGSTWSELLRGIVNVRVRSFTVDTTTTPPTLFVVDQGGHSFRSEANGDWTRMAWGFSDRAVAVGATGRLFVLTDSFGGRNARGWRSDDRGQTLQPLDLSFQEGFVAEFMDVDRNDRDTLYLGAAGLVVRGDGAGTTFTYTGYNMLSPITSLAVDPARPGTVYVGNRGAIQISTDRAATWTLRALPTTWDVKAVVADPGSSSVLYVATNGDGVLRSLDGGATWEPSNTGIEADARGRRNLTALAVGSADGAHLFVGGELGVFESHDRGALWTPVRDGLLNWGIQSFAVVAETNLYAGTFLAGIHVLSLNAEGTTTTTTSPSTTTSTTLPGEACPAAPAPTCRGASAPTPVVVRGKKGATQVRLSWRWQHGGATTIEEFGDPTTTTSYEWCVYVSSGLVLGRPVPAGGVCAGKSCWRRTKGGALVYTNGNVADGIARVQLRPGADGKAAIALSAKGIVLSGRGSVDFVAQLHSSTGVCWGDAF